MREQKFIYSVITLAVLALVAGMIFDLRGFESSVPSQVTTAYEDARSQGTKERTWRPERFEKLFTVGGRAHQGEGPLLYASSLKVAGNGSAFVVDGGEWTIKEFSPAGELVARYGNGQGAGPGEFMSITDFDISHKDQVWVADARGRRVTIFERGGKIARIVSLDSSPYKIVRNSSSTFTILALGGSGELFGQFAEDGRKLRTFGESFEKSSSGSLVFNGLLAPDGTGGFLFAGRYVGLLARYSALGVRSYAVKPIGGETLPKMFRAPNGDRWVDREEVANVQSVSISGNKFFVLAPVRQAIKTIGAIDVYNLETGLYLASLRLPAPAKHLAVVGDYLYTVDNRSLTKWRCVGLSDPV